MNCQKCNGETVYPEGLSGERVCKSCGLVYDPTQIASGFTQWNPEWCSNWSQIDSEPLKEWLTTLRTVSCQLSVPAFPYREEAARTIRKESQLLFKSQKLGKHKRAATAALIHLVLREYDKARPLKEICQNLSLNERLVTKQLWTLKKTINHKKDSFKKQRKTPKEYLFENGGKLTSDSELLLTAERMLKKLRRRISGNPISFSAAVFYHVCKKRKAKISKNRIGEAFGISGRTVYSNERRIRDLAAL